MEEKIIKEIKWFELHPEDHKILTIEEIKNNLNRLDIEAIDLTCEEYYRREDGVISILHNDKEHPLVLHDNIFSKVLKINPKWYLENQEVADELIRYICKNINQEKIKIYEKALIDDKLIDSICANKNLTIIDLRTYESEKGYILTKEHYQKFKESNKKTIDTDGIVDGLQDNFDPIINYNNSKHLIEMYKYKDLTTEEKLYIDEILTDEEISYLEYLNPNSTIYFQNESWKNIDKIKEKLEKLGKQNKLVIDIKEKEEFNKLILKTNIISKDIYVKNEGETLLLKDYLRFEKQLYEMIEEAKDLSPFEKYIYAYNKTKTFKKYKENTEDKSQSRDLYKILENKFMVCVGFSEMFGDLLNKLEIKNNDLSVSVDISYDKAYKGEEEIEGIEKITEKGGHARRYIYIKDEKYGIDGYYISDPTWDNDLEHDYYNHLAMTNEEVTNARRYIWINKYNSSELLNVKSIEEFYQKINFLLDREKNPFLFGNIEEIEKENLNERIKDLINDQIKPLDPNYIEQLKNKYSFINKYKWPKNQDITDLIYDLGEYIVNHVNKEIKGETIIEAVGNVYQKVYGYKEEEWENKKEQLIEENKERQSKSFPKRYRTNDNGFEEVIMNEKNKFEFNDTDIKER